MPIKHIPTQRGTAMTEYRFKKGGRLEYHVLNAEDLGLLQLGWQYLPWAETTKEDLLELLTEHVQSIYSL